MKKTLIVHGRYAWRHHRTRAALAGKHGVQIFTMDQAAARLAGGFLRPIDHEDLQGAVAEALATSLGEVDSIKALPGFQRAATASLAKAWAAGLALDAEASDARDRVAKARLEALASLEQVVLKRLPRNQRRPADLLAEALQRVESALTVLGRIEVHGHTEMPPVWRPLLSALARVTEVTWIAGARRVPDWLASSDVKIERSAAAEPAIRTVACASPRHEILEALRWARRLLTTGIKPERIAIAAAAPETWDDHVLAIAEAANLPVHFVHGRAALSTSEGQLAASLAEILLRGYSRARILRLVALLRTRIARFQLLPPDLGQFIPPDAPLLAAEQWHRAIEALDADTVSGGTDHRPLLCEIIEIIGTGLKAAKEIGERLFEGRTLALWRKALTEGPPAALDVTLAGLRVDDGLDPEAAVVWAPGSAIAAVPRPYTWLVGLSSRSWPRRADEDPLLPDHVIAPGRLDPLPIHQADRRDFASICASTSNDLICSRARRDAGGRLNGVSPLYPREVEETYLAQSREPEYAATESDRLMARPAEFSALPVARSAWQTWGDWHRDALTAHEGLVRANHPVLLRALERRQSASSLTKLLRDPLGYLWMYGFGWSAPQETDEPLTLDALTFGNLLHEILQKSVMGLEATKLGGFGQASGETIRRAIADARTAVANRWENSVPVPPPVIWQRKCEEAAALAEKALTHANEPLPKQRSWAEVPFGGVTKAEEIDEAILKTLPWDLAAPVEIPGTGIAIGGFIDRLDLSEDRKMARVTDYKSGRPPSRKEPPQLNGGSELQRCLYAYAVVALIGTEVTVEAQLLYPRDDGPGFTLEDPSATVQTLARYLNAAAASFRAGNSLPGPAAGETWYDLALALPGGARETYLAMKEPLVRERLAKLAPLWDEP
jgi:hypothetical protein